MSNFTSLSNGGSSPLGQTASFRDSKHFLSGNECNNDSANSFLEDPRMHSVYNDTPSTYLHAFSGSMSSPDANTRQAAEALSLLGESENNLSFDDQDSYTLDDKENSYPGCPSDTLADSSGGIDFTLNFDLGKRSSPIMSICEKGTLCPQHSTKTYRTFKHQNLSFTCIIEIYATHQPVTERNGLVTSQIYAEKHPSFFEGCRRNQQPDRSRPHKRQKLDEEL